MIARSLLAGAVVAVLVAWGLVLWPATIRQTQSGFAVRNEEKLSVSVQDSFGAKTINFVRSFGEDWSPIKACGPPDTMAMGDLPSAWASFSPDDQAEWLEVDFAKPVFATSVKVFETNAPGALSRVSVEESGKMVPVWTGQDPAAPDEHGIFIAEIPISSSKPVWHVRLDLDSRRVRGWNEIDAVGLVAPDRTVQWAIRARASSTYERLTPSMQASPDLHPLASLVPSWAPISWEPARFPSTELRAFEARGWPFLAVWGQTLLGQTARNPLLLHRPIWGGLAMDATIYGAVLFVLYLATFGLRRFVRDSLRLRRGLCMQCGYDLRYDLVNGCPECGWRRQSSTDPRASTLTRQ